MFTDLLDQCEQMDELDTDDESETSDSSLKKGILSYSYLSSNRMIPEPWYCLNVLLWYQSAQKGNYILFYYFYKFKFIESLCHFKEWYFIFSYLLSIIWKLLKYFVVNCYFEYYRYWYLFKRYKKKKNC